MSLMHAGIYIHIPFCRSHCSYCDFATGMYEGELADRYVNSLIREITDWHEVGSPSEVDTIYFGGGTPSLLTPSQIERILKAVHDHFQVVDGAEVTMEMNPASIVSAPREVTQRRTPLAGQQTNGDSPELSSRKLQDFRGFGINRASFGAQTFEDRE